jgi:hypothetical protein
MWRRKRRPSAETSDARRRLEKAREQLDVAKADNDQVDRVTGALAELGRRNHFGPMISQAIRGSR